MRTLLYGQYDAQFADLTMAKAIHGSQIIDGAGSDATYAFWTEQTHFDFGYSTTVGSRYRTYIKVAMDNIRAAIGHNAVIIRARLCCYHSYWGDDQATTLSLAARRILNPPTYDDVSSRYRDITGAITWTNDAYAPMPDVDMVNDPLDTVSWVCTASGMDVTTPSLKFELTTEFQRCLRSGEDLQIVLRQENDNVVAFKQYTFFWDQAGYKSRRPYLQIDYMEPIEFYRATAGGDIDLTGLLNNTTGLDTDDLDLGNLQREEVGTPVKAFAKNFSGTTFNILELWDDYPEWTDPVQTAGTGTGSLDYVTLAEASVSQKYTVKMLSSTTYEVLAEAYANNVTGLHTAYDADPSWQGAVGTDFTAPDGGLTLPTAAWTAGTLVNDEFVVYVIGNSSDPTWPADSNDQTYITTDDAGSPLTAGWRRIDGQRTRSTASVTIDATTKAVSTKHLDSALWIVGQPCFITDGTNTDEGTVQSATATSVTITGLAVTSNVYAAGARVGTSLLIGSLAAAVWARSTAAFGASSTPANRIPLTDPATAGFIAAQTVHIASVDNTAVYETGVIQTVGASYIDLTAVMASDYESGALIVVSGSGEAPFWLRAETTAVTTLERKRSRINART